MFLKHHIEDVNIEHTGILPTFLALAKTTRDTIIASECHFPLSGTIMTLQVFRFGLLSSPVTVCKQTGENACSFLSYPLVFLVSLANQTDCHKFLLLRSDFGHICYRLGSIREQCTTPANRLLSPQRIFFVTNRTLLPWTDIREVEHFSRIFCSKDI